MDATRIAMETLGRPITNTAILGAFAKVTGMVSLESLERAVLGQWPGKIGEVNVRAVRRAYEEANDPVDVSGVEGIKVKRLSFLDRDVSSWRIFRPEIDAEKCVGCRRCYIFCPEVAISMAEGKAVINYQYCKGCGICYEECPAKAISFEEEAI